MSNKKEPMVPNACGCDNNKVFISHDMVGSFLACMLVMMFAFLAIGFWAGRWLTLQQFTSQMQEEQFSDSIESTFYSGTLTSEEASIGDNDTNDDTDSGRQSLNEESTIVQEDVERSLSGENNVLCKVDVKTDITLYYAELAGFKSLSMAQKFENRLINKQIRVYTKKRHSKDVKGRVHIWYQVVTHPYNSLEELEKIVSAIRKQEHLKGEIPLLMYTQEEQ